MAKKKELLIFLQLPYTQQSMDPMVVMLKHESDATALRAAGTHRIIMSESEMVRAWVVTPIVPAEHLVFQIGEEIR